VVTFAPPRLRLVSRYPSVASRHDCVRPKGADYQWGKDPLEQLMVRFDSWRAVSPGNRAYRSLVTKPTYGGRATLQAVTRVKLEQASKTTMWKPTRHNHGEGRADWEEPGVGTRHPLITISTDRATGVVSTACKEGSLHQWGRPGMEAGVAYPQTWSERTRVPSGRRRGPRYR
jgi:hypothetical protein